MQSIVVLLFMCLVTGRVSSYKPVVLLHGVLSAAKEMEVMADFITKAHPGTVVYNIDLYENSESVDISLWVQLRGVLDKMRSVLEDPGGVHMVCHSQGGLLCRAMLETLSTHNVHNFISLSAPMMGQFGMSDYIHVLFPGYTEDHLYLLFYTEEAQEHFSVANYWRDPYHLEEYFKYCNFLTTMCNGTKPASKENFLRLKNLVLFGGKDDGVITPWQSSQFGFYDKNLTVIPMQQQQVYTDDLFGLRTLDKRGGLKLYSIDGVEHTHWRQNQSVFDCCIEPWLD